jgi:hypothetical protein
MTEADRLLKIREIREGNSDFYITDGMRVVCCTGLYIHSEYPEEHDFYTLSTIKKLYHLIKTCAGQQTCMGGNE